MLVVLRSVAIRCCGATSGSKLTFSGTCAGIRSSSPTATGPQIGLLQPAVYKDVTPYPLGLSVRRENRAARRHHHRGRTSS
jgi:hypothetical protein